MFDLSLSHYHDICHDIEDMIFYLRNNLDNTIIGGDFNCILSPRDSSSNSTHVCKALLDIFRNLDDVADITVWQKNIPIGICIPLKL